MRRLQDCGRTALGLALALLPLSAPVAHAQDQAQDIKALAQDLRAAREAMESQRQALEARIAHVRSLEARLAAIETGRAPDQLEEGTRMAQAEPVGERPRDNPAQPALVDDGAKVLTRRGQLTAELSLDYAQANRSRALFRGIGASDALLIGVFDINESEQHVLGSALALRYGVSDGLEISGRLPFVRRSDKDVLTPIRSSGTTQGQIDSSTHGSGLGDAEVGVRYQLNGARGGNPYFIANAMVEIPTGKGAFEVSRDADGVPTEAATGAGFWGVGGGLTVILPSDPGALFAGISYLKNFGQSVDTVIGSSQIDYVNPGDSFSFNGGLGLAINDRTSFNFGYAHSWILPTHVRSHQLGDATMAETIQRYSELHLGRLLFGITHRVSQRSSISWSVEVGATSDAPDVRTSLRIPIVLMTGE